VPCLKAKRLRCKGTHCVKINCKANSRGHSRANLLSKEPGYVNINKLDDGADILNR
jgi:hypothetical protein